MNIGMKIFYNNKTGEIVYSTGDMLGNVEETPNERLVSIFNIDNQYDILDMGFIQLDYGSNLNQMPVSVNIETQEITWADLPPKRTFHSSFLLQQGS